MPLSFDIHENEFLEEIYQQGRVESVRQVLLKQLEQKFCSLPAATRDRVSSASAETLMSWIDRVLGSSSLEEIFEGK